MMNYYQIPKLKNHSCLFHAFSNREAGDFGNENVLQNIEENHMNWLRQFNIDNNKLKVMPVVGGSNIAILNEQNKSLPEDADAIITDQRDIYLCLTVADCLPIILFDCQKLVLALVHAGWRGTDKNIAAKTVDAMRNNFGCNSKKIIAGIGPAIHKPSYIKDKAFREKISADLNKYVSDCSENKVQVDLISANVDQLMMTGIEGENIEISDQDTYAGNYFSHHRAKESGELDGRNLVIVGIK